MIPGPVLAAFGLTGSPERLPGGEETSVVVDGVVLKPAFDPALADWCQRLADAVDTDRLQVPAPVAASDGRFVVEGWTATRFVPGLRSLRGQPETVVALDPAVTEAFTAAADTLPPLPARTDRWARWVDAALDGSAPGLRDDAQDVLRRLREHTGPPPRRTHVVHGDLTGNSFRDGTGNPLVLDLSPYQAPAGFGAAVVVADHLLWHDGSADLVGSVDPDLLARALVFRLVAEQLATDPRHGARLGDYERPITLLASR
ncbi:MAG: hypothetical protein AAGA90_19730 [Actinomycetota bacterium]